MVDLRVLALEARHARLEEDVGALKAELHAAAQIVAPAIVPIGVGWAERPIEEQVVANAELPLVVLENFLEANPRHAANSVNLRAAIERLQPDETHFPVERDVHDLRVVEDGPNPIMRPIAIVASAQTRPPPGAERIDADQALDAPPGLIRIVEVGGWHRRTCANPKVQSTDLREDLRNLNLHRVDAGDGACHRDCVSATGKTQRIRAIAVHGIDA